MNQFTDCAETNGPGKNTECLVCQESIADDMKTVTHRACGIAWHFECFSSWYSFSDKNPLCCPFCKSKITGSVPISPGEAVVCFCLHTLKDQVEPFVFEAKPLGQREGSRRFSNSEVVDIITANAGDERVKGLATRSLQAFRVKEWVLLSFNEAEHQRRCFLPYDFEAGAERPRCCPTYHEAKHNLKGANTTTDDPKSGTTNPSLKKRITSFFKS